MAQSHSVMTTFRSMPWGRSGCDFGSAPWAIRSLHSPKSSQRASCVELTYGGDHAATGLTRLDPVLPCVRGGVEFAQRRWKGAGRLITNLVTGDAAIGLDHAQPLALVLEAGRHAIAVHAGAREKAFVRDFQHRIPIDRGVIRGRGSVRGRGHRVKRQRVARGGLNLWRIYKAITANPHAVARPGQIGHQEAPLAVRHHDPGVFGGQITRFGDDPDAGFRPFRPGDDSADVVRPGMDRRRHGTLGVKTIGGHGRGNGKDRSRHQQFQAKPSCHLELPHSSSSSAKSSRTLLYSRPSEKADRPGGFISQEIWLRYQSITLSGQLKSSILQQLIVGAGPMTA